jgi:hypothetical protein
MKILISQMKKLSYHLRQEAIFFRQSHRLVSRNDATNS